MKRRKWLIGFLATLLLLLITVGHTPSAMADLTTTSVGEENQIGNGSVRTWVKVDDNDKPVSIGVSLTSAGLTALNSRRVL